MEKYKYILFGLNVLSDLKLNFTQVDINEKDVELIIEIKSTDLPSDEFIKDIDIKLEKDRALFHVLNVADFDIIKGYKVIVYPSSENNDVAITEYLLGTVFGILIHQRGDIPIHGSAISLGNDYAIIITGQSGAGKSSLTNGFIKNGYKYISDDVSRIIENENELFVIPSYPSRRLCEDTLIREDIDYRNMNRIVDNDFKYMLNDKEGFYSRAQKIVAIYNIETVDCTKVKLERMNTKSAFETITKNIYRDFMIYVQRNERLLFDLSVRLYKQTKIYNIYRPENLYSVESQMHLILEELIIEKNLER